MEPTTADKIRDVMSEHAVSESTARRWLKAGRARPGKGPGHPRVGKETRVQAAVLAYVANTLPFKKALKKSGLSPRTFRRRIRDCRDGKSSLPM